MVQLLDVDTDAFRAPTTGATAADVPVFRRIVVGVDFSEPSLRAARWIASTFAPSAEIVLVHVGAPPTLSAFARPSAADTRPVYHALRGLAETLGRERTSTTIVLSTPARGLALVADDVGADAICLGRSPRLPTGTVVEPATALALLSQSNHTLLVVPAGGTLDASAPVVVALDEQRNPAAMVRLAQRVAQTHRAPVETVRLTQLEQARIDRLGDRANDVDPAWRLLQFTRSRGAGLLVLGRDQHCGSGASAAHARPLPGTTRLLLGVARCPLMVVPAHHGSIVSPRHMAIDRR